VSKLNYFLKGNTKIAYRYYKRSKKNLVFIHGLLSDMNGKNPNISIITAEKKIYHFYVLIFKVMVNQMVIL
jgi:hypothetical protein